MFLINILRFNRRINWITWCYLINFFFVIIVYVIKLVITKISLIWLRIYFWFCIYIFCLAITNNCSSFWYYIYRIFNLRFFKYFTFILNICLFIIINTISNISYTIFFNIIWRTFRQFIKLKHLFRYFS